MYVIVIALVKVKNQQISLENKRNLKQSSRLKKKPFIIDTNRNNLSYKTKE